MFVSVNFLFAENLQKKFIKGNLADKTAAVKEATSKDSLWLSTKAIDFVIENQEFLGDDKELAGLALAGILSFPNEAAVSYSDIEKKHLSSKLVKIYNHFNKDSTVQIAVLSKFVSLNNVIPSKDFSIALGKSIMEKDNSETDPALLHAIVSTLGSIGDNFSFMALYVSYMQPAFKDVRPDIMDSLSKLIYCSKAEILQIIYLHDLVHLQNIYNLISNSSNISQNLLSEIAENLLNESIVLAGSNSEKIEDITKIQLGTVDLLNKNKCTRAAACMISYYNFAKKQFNEGIISEQQFAQVISALGNVAPIDSVEPLISYLEQLNAATEAETKVSAIIVTAVINTLGAIGDKSAFDSLLAATYLTYPDSVLYAAREALAGLKW